MPGDREKQLVLVLRKIPVFEGLMPFQIKRIVGVCKHRFYQPGDTICYVDTPSTAMYVLISGELSIISSQNARVATILPVTTVGEMGVLTGQPRSATVEVSKPSAILTIQKVQFDAIMDDDVHIQVKVYQNIVKALSDKLGNDNLRLRDLQLEIESAQERLGHLRSGYKKAQQRTDDAFSLAASYGDMQRDKFEAEHSDTLQEHMPRFLIVDGDVNCCALLQDALGQFEVIVASNGNEAVHTHMTNTRITDPEILEHRYPVRLERFSIRPQSGGSGAYTGGNGVIRELVFLESMSLSLLSQRRQQGPYGLAGGSAGKPGTQLLIRQSGLVTPLKAIDAQDVEAGDRLILETPGGGGYGQPT